MLLEPFLEDGVADLVRALGGSARECRDSPLHTRCDRANHAADDGSSEPVDETRPGERLGLVAALLLGPVINSVPRAHEVELIDSTELATDPLRVKGA